MGGRHVIANNYLQDLAGHAGGGIVLSCGHADNRPAGNPPVTNVVVAHNTLVHNARAAFKLDSGCGTQGRTERPANVRLLNNLVVENAGPLFEGEAGENVVLAGNLLLGKADPGLLPGGVRVGDTKLTFAPDHLWRPGVDSPVSDAGVATGIVLIDMDGQERDAAPDIGADELSAAAVVTKPLTSRDVGPAWMK